MQIWVGNGTPCKLSGNIRYWSWQGLTKEARQGAKELPCRWIIMEIIQLCHILFWRKAFWFAFPSIKCITMQNPNVTLMTSDSLSYLGIFLFSVHRRHFQSCLGSPIFKARCSSAACCCRLPHHWLTGSWVSSLQFVACDQDTISNLSQYILIRE